MKKTSFIKRIQLWGIIILIMIAGSIIIFDIVISHQDFNFRVEQMRVDYIAKQKQLIKSEVNRVVAMINNERVQSETVTKEKVKSRVYEAYAIAQHIYQQNEAAKSQAEIKQMILDALRPIRFAEGRGYYFATRLDGVEMLFADRPEMEGLNLLDVQDTHGQYFVRETIETVRQHGEGFQEYYWTKPGAKGKDFKKISFAKRFKPLNWFIGTGLYVDDIEASIKEDLMRQIDEMRFGANGYFFVDSFQGVSLAHGIQPGLIGTNMWETEDSKGNKTTQMLVAAAQKENGGYVSYWWRKSSTAKESPKVAFAKSIPEWGILVGTGVYLDDVENDIAAIHTKLNKQIKKKILSFALVLIGLIIFVLFCLNRLNRRLKNDFNLFSSFFNQAAHSDEPIDRDLVQFAELDLMAVNANKMLQDKMYARQALLGKQEALRESEKKYRSLTDDVLDTSTVGIFILDSDFKVVWVNQVLEEYFGLKRNEIIGKDKRQLIHEKIDHIFENPDYFKNKVFTTYDDNTYVERFECHILSDGEREERWLEHRSQPIQSGLYAGGRIEHYYDITDIKQAQKALLESELKFREMANLLPQVVYESDIQGNLTFLNEQAYNLFGYSQEDVDKGLNFIHSLVPEDRARAKENINNIVNGNPFENVEYTVIKKDGLTSSIMTYTSPIIKDRKVAGLRGIIVDISERKQMEEELLKVRKLESVGVLAGGIAHDFNNILAAILGNISLALTTVDPKDEIYELLIESEKASLRAKDLTQQLLTFAKGGEPVKKIAVIDEIIKDSAEFVLRGSNVRCDFKFGDELWPVAIDTGQISQVIQNIVVNASQAMPTGGVVSIDCSNYCLKSSNTIPVSPGNYIKIVIKDQGVGIPVDMLGKIFDPYFTTKQKGSGLGLAITHSIISKHDGYITADSELGQGTTFTIYLTASQGIPELEPKDIIVPPIIVHGKILIMDDEEMIRSLAERALSRGGYEVVLAADGNEAVQFYRKAKEAGAPIDLIIMDLTIPGGMGGEEAIKEIHKIDPEVKVIVSSGYSNDPVMAGFSEYGFCAAMVKPFQIKELMEVVGKAVSS